MASAGNVVEAFDGAELGETFWIVYDLDQKMKNMVLQVLIRVIIGIEELIAVAFKRHYVAPGPQFP
jgi:hypothetical protein